MTTAPGKEKVPIGDAIGFEKPFPAWPEMSFPRVKEGAEGCGDENMVVFRIGRATRMCTGRVEALTYQSGAKEKLPLNFPEGMSPADVERLVVKVYRKVSGNDLCISGDEDSLPSIIADAGEFLAAPHMVIRNAIKEIRRQMNAPIGPDGNKILPVVGGVGVDLVFHLKSE